MQPLNYGHGVALANWICASSANKCCQQLDKTTSNVVRKCIFLTFTLVFGHLPNFSAFVLLLLFLVLKLLVYQEFQSIKAASEVQMKVLRKVVQTYNFSSVMEKCVAILNILSLWNWLWNYWFWVGPSFPFRITINISRNTLNSLSLVFYFFPNATEI